MEKDLYSRVNENVHNPMLQNTRPIDVQAGTLITLGYKDDNSSFALMGIYQEGDINPHDYFVELTNTLIIHLTDITTVKLFDMRNSDTMETAEWWRVATDDEVKLYKDQFSKRFQKKVTMYGKVWENVNNKYFLHGDDWWKVITFEENGHVLYMNNVIGVMVLFDTTTGEQLECFI